jgi:ABC-type phosphate transport system permease subunit
MRPRFTLRKPIVYAVKRSPSNTLGPIIMKTMFRRLAVAVLGCLAIGLAQAVGATAIVGIRIDQTLSFDCNPLLSYSPTLSSTSQSNAFGDATRSLTVSTQSSNCTGAKGAAKQKAPRALY